MIVKIHPGSHGKKIIAICDSSLIGKKIDNGKVQLDLSSNFYNGKEMEEKEILKLFSDVYIVNLVGENSVALGVKAGIVIEENAIDVSGVPHAQAMLL